MQFPNRKLLGIDPNKVTVDEAWASRSHIWHNYEKTPDYGYLSFMSALQVASFLGHTEIVAELLNSGADIEYRTEKKRTLGDYFDKFYPLLASYPPIYLATKGGHSNTVNILIERKAKLLPYKRTDFDKSKDKYPFQIAFHNNDLAVLKILTKNTNFLVNIIKENYYYWILKNASLKQRYEILNWLIDEIGNELFNKIFDIPIIRVAEEWLGPKDYHPDRTWNFNILKLFLENLNDNNIRKISIQYLVNISVEARTIETLEYLLNKYNPDLNLLIDDIDPSFKKTEYPLIEASKFGYSEIVELLLSKGADPNITDNKTKKGWTPLILAILNMTEFAHLDISELRSLDKDSGVDFPGTIRLLLEESADVNTTTKKDVNLDQELENCIMSGAYFDPSEKKKLLTSGTSALMIAAMGNSSDSDVLNIIDMLIEFGADVHQKREDGHTATTLAKDIKIAAKLT